MVRLSGTLTTIFAKLSAGELSGWVPTASYERVSTGSAVPLERELARKDQALAEAATLLVLKKKVAHLWEVEGDDTDPESGR